MYLVKYFSENTKSIKKKAITAITNINILVLSMASTTQNQTEFKMLNS